MPKKNNQNKPNGFILYAEEIKNQLLREGHAIRTKPDLIAAASPKWQNLPDDEKEYYKEKAKWEWENRHITGQYQKKPNRNQNRRDCLGKPISDRVDVVQMNDNKRRKERQDVFQTFPLGRGVIQKRFYFIDFISLLDEPTEDGWPSLEVGVVEFSLQNGIMKTWHKFINPDRIPQGYRFKSQNKSELQHLIPVEGIAPPYDTYTQIYDELFHFLSQGTQIIPPIYCKMSDCERVEGCIKYLAEHAGRPNQLKRVYELEGLILDLDAHLNGHPQNFQASKSIGTELISSTIFDYDSGTRCNYHEENETKYCALGTVNKYCYCLGDYFCKQFDIPITEYHLPVKKNEPYYTLIQSTSQKQKTKKRPENKRAEDILNLVNEKLKIEADNQESREQDLIETERQWKAEREAQRKRWQALRGGAIESNSMENNEASNIKKQNETSVSPPPTTTTNNIPMPTPGRGRSRGRALLANLRRPGEPAATEIKPPPGFGRMGRGVILKENSVISDKKWAGAAAAPAAEQAPLPPSAWVG